MARRPPPRRPVITYHVTDNSDGRPFIEFHGSGHTGFVQDVEEVRRRVPQTLIIIDEPDGPLRSGHYRMKARNPGTLTAEQLRLAFIAFYGASLGKYNIVEY